jgi:hypothetical protein
MTEDPRLSRPGDGVEVAVPGVVDVHAVLLEELAGRLRAALQVGFGRIVVSETEAPIMFVNLV